MAGFISLILMVITFLSYIGMIEIISSPLKQLVDALILLGDNMRNWMQSL